MVMSEKESSFGFSAANSSHKGGFNASLFMSTNQVRVPFAESLVKRRN
jgi:hypothetical protein